MGRAFAFFFILLCLQTCVCDIYMHNPRGSNNRLNENSANRRNANRLFDSQNNNRGGYNVGEKCPSRICTGTALPNGQGNRADLTDEDQVGRLNYHSKSLLSVEWTAQHGCDNPKMQCEFIVQVACDGILNKKTANGVPWKMSDGSQTGNGQNDLNPPVTGRHEPDVNWQKCQKRERNKGLFTADQNMRNRNTARHTRQDNNGNRYGNECNEERDYYPYWHPTPWKDVAILTSNTSRCDYYEEEFLKSVGECECSAPPCDGNEQTCWTHNNPKDCNGEATTSCIWNTKPRGNYFDSFAPMEALWKAPLCQQTEFSRDNHLGNTPAGHAPMFNWTIPEPNIACGDPSGCQCVLRIRYNITTIDLHGMTADMVEDGLPYFGDYWNVNASLNSRNPGGGNEGHKIKMSVNPDTGSTNYFEDNPDVDIGAGAGLRLALNTDQYGRTFQDRSHLFNILPSVPGMGDRMVFNINVRGKRGNIVQCYPAVEYDFTPNMLHINQGDYLHFQWTGSNSHNNGNPAGDGQAGDDGEGTGGTDRSNVVQIETIKSNVPLPIEGVTLFPNREMIRKFASVDTENPDPLLNNAPAFFDGGALTTDHLEPGTYYYMSTRNNNFSNRSQKGTIIVHPRGAQRVGVPNARN
uniref:Protein DD3-3 n=1 Tax=Palpitomonas bilix TaxID=652834 RepID=A0A7S3LTK1_9EUKA|mmetsp:Transcript_46180/g.119000  ORF Transcript_46180/g.119000 Transcript_46180/m.119000 type:complete len:635 (+) Transcript_46180:40-1944(+)